MADQFNISRFVEKHQEDFDTAFEEIKNGEKETHWMWYIFPQLKGLGRSWPSQFYGIENLDEARAFLDDPYLGENLRKISQELLKLETNNAFKVFGHTDARKLKSSMTLFAHADPQDPVFKKVLEKYFGGKEDYNTLKSLD